MSKVLVFDVRGKMAVFRKPYTTTSTVSFPFPPPSTIAGMISAILGIKNGQEEKANSSLYWNEVNGISVALRILSEVRYYRTALNLSNTKDPQKSPRIQVKHQILRDPHYRIYVKFKPEHKLYSELKSRLERQEFHFTPYLGVAYAIADVDFVGEFSPEKVSGRVGIDSVLPMVEGVVLDVEKTGGVFKEVVPLKMDAERKFVSSISVAYLKSPGKIFLKDVDENVEKVGDDVVVWFPEL